MKCSSKSIISFLLILILIVIVPYAQASIAETRRAAEAAKERERQLKEQAAQATTPPRLTQSAPAGTPQPPAPSGLTAAERAELEALRRQLAAQQQAGQAGQAGAVRVQDFFAEFERKFVDFAQQQQALDEFDQLIGQNDQQAVQAVARVFRKVQDRVVQIQGQANLTAQQQQEQANLLNWLINHEQGAIVALRTPANNALQAIQAAQYAALAAASQAEYNAIIANQAAWNVRAQDFPLLNLLKADLQLFKPAVTPQLLQQVRNSIGYGATNELKALFYVLHQAGFGNLPPRAGAEHPGKSIYLALAEKIENRNQGRDPQIAGAVPQAIKASLSTAIEEYLPIDVATIVNRLNASIPPVPPLPDANTIKGYADARPLLILIALQPKANVKAALDSRAALDAIRSLYPYTSTDDLKLVLKYLTSAPDAIDNASSVNLKRIVKSLDAEIARGVARPAAQALGRTPRQLAARDFFNFLTGNLQAQLQAFDAIAVAGGPPVGGPPVGGPPVPPVGGPAGALAAQCANPAAQAGWTQLANARVKEFTGEWYVVVNAPLGADVGAGPLQFRGMKLDNNAILTLAGVTGKFTADPTVAGFGQLAKNRGKMVNAWYDPAGNARQGEVKCVTALLDAGNNWRTN